MKNYLTKKNVLIGSSFLGVVFLAMLFIVLNDICGSYSRDCKNIFGVTAGFLFPFPFLFFFSLITYKMREEVFQAWWMFTRWWIPLSILLVLIMPSDNGVLLPIDKGHIAILTSGLFFALSSTIVIITYMKTQKE